MSAEASNSCMAPASNGQPGCQSLVTSTFAAAAPPGQHHRWGMVTLLLGVALIVLSGCAGHYITRADRAAAASQHAQATMLYRRALDLKPSLAQDPGFMLRYNHAHARQLFDQAQRQQAAGAFEQAVASYEKALSLDEDFDAARAALSRARTQAAEALYQRALKAADEANLELARRHIQTSLDYDADHAPARAADRMLRSPGVGEPGGHHTAGVQRAHERDWLAAVRAFDQAIALDEAHLHARVARAQALQQLERARALHAAAREVERDGQLDHAIDLYEQALAVWTTYDEAQQKLAHARAQRQQAQQHLDDAIALHRQRQWDDALRELEQSLSRYARFEQALQLRARTLQDAAEDHVARGQAHRQADRADDAAASYHAALRYVANHAGARRGLAQLSFDEGERMLQADRPGAAIIAFTQARRIYPDDAPRQRLTQAREQIHAQLQTTLRLSVTDAAGRTTAQSDAARANLTREIRRFMPAFITLEAQPQQADYDIQVTLRDIDLRVQRTGTEKLTHRYTIYRTVPNPAIPKLEHDLHALHLELRGLRRDYDRAILLAHRARDHGHEGDHSRHMHRAHQLSRQIDHRQRQARQIEHELRSQPPHVQQATTYDWPYTRHTYTKDGRLTLQVRIMDEAAQAMADSFAVQGSSRDADSVIENANPEIGLAVDSLTLRTDQSMLDEMLGSTSTQAGQILRDSLLKGQAAILDHRASQYEREDKAAEALEARVASALALEPIDPAQTARTLEALARP